MADEKGSVRQGRAAYLCERQRAPLKKSGETVDSGRESEYRQNARYKPEERDRLVPTLSHSRRFRDVLLDPAVPSVDIPAGVQHSSRHAAHDGHPVPRTEVGD